VTASHLNQKEEHSGGEGGIRTPDTLSGMPVFKTGAINHSATSPREGNHKFISYSAAVFGSSFWVVG
jgi:hypothetical protein